MAITQQTIVDQIEVTASNVIQIRFVNQFVDDSTTPPTVTPTGFHRSTVAPGDDYSQEDAKVQAICAAVHTPEVIAEYQAQLAANQPVGA